MSNFVSNVHARYTVLELDPEFFARVTQDALMPEEAKKIYLDIQTLRARLFDQRAFLDMQEKP